MKYIPMKIYSSIILFALILMLFATGKLEAEDDVQINYTEHYKFPFSMGVSYQGISPFSDYGSDFDIYEISGVFKLPIPNLPFLQPLLQVGIAQYDARDYRNSGDKWDHFQGFGGLGISYINRFSKDFEVGFSFIAGGALSIFPQLSEDRSYSLPYVFFETGGHIALTPSYNISIDVSPKLKYQYAITPAGVDISDFDGFSVGLGIAVNYRFGENPDSASSLIRSIRFSDTELHSVFAAMQSFYITNPIGKAVLVNKENTAVKNMEVSFFQTELMDAPTPCISIDSIDPGESVEIPLYAYFNDRVFNVEGVKPYTGEIIVQYEYKNRAAEQRHSISYDLHDKTALTWDNAEKVAAYITPADSALRNYSSYIRQIVKDETVSSFNNHLQSAIQIYNGLDVLGLLYQSDPSSPFTVVQGNTQVIDSISLPRDTLKRITGDCDDLTVLYCSLLETLGIETAFITVPGHIYAAFNTKIPSSGYKEINPDRNMTINLNGELWVPVEITLIGTSGFTEAWRKGASQWHALDDQVESRDFFSTEKAQQTFRAVGLKEIDLGLQYGNTDIIRNKFRDDFREIQQIVLLSYEETVADRGRKQGLNQLGVKYAMFERYSDARNAFSRSISLDKNYLPAQINLANLEYITGNSGKALYAYESVLENLHNQGRGDTKIAGKLKLNLARSYYESEKYNEAKDLFAEAQQIVPEESQKYAYLSSLDDSGTRASSRELQNLLIFIEDENFEN